MRERDQQRRRAIPRKDCEVGSDPTHPTTDCYSDGRGRFSRSLKKGRATQATQATQSSSRTPPSLTWSSCALSYLPPASLATSYPHPQVSTYVCVSPGINRDRANRLARFDRTTLHLGTASILETWCKGFACPNLNPKSSIKDIF